MNPHLVLKTVSKALIPLIALFALYVQFHGDFGPGGGFQAGVIMAAAVILYALVYGLQEAKRAVPPIVVRLGASLGALLFAGVGVATLFLGGDYLDYDVLPGGQHAGIILVELGVLLTVASVMVIIFYAFSGRARDISDEEW